MGQKNLLLSILLFFTGTLKTVVYLTTFNSSSTGVTYVSSLVRSYRKFTAGSDGLITRVTLNYGPVSQDEALAATAVSINIYADNSGIRGSLVGTLTYESQDTGNRLATYVGAIAVSETTDYWFEIRCTGATFGYYYALSLDTAGSSDGWNFATALSYPIIKLEKYQTVSRLVTLVDVASADYLKNGGLYLDFSGTNLTAMGQVPLDALDGLDGVLDDVTKSNVTYLNLSNNDLTEVPANIFSSFTHLHILELNNNLLLTTLNANAFSGLTITGVVNLSGCTALTTLPANIFSDLTTEHLLLNNCAITSINRNTFTGLTITGDLHLNNNPLVTIPSYAFEGLAVGGNLYLNYCSALTTLQTHAFTGLITSHLFLDHNPSLTTIGSAAFDGMELFGNLFLHNTGIVTFSADMFNGSTGATVSKIVRCDTNNALTTINNGAFTNLTALHLLLHDNSALTTINNYAFNGLTTSSDLGISNCSNLTSLPANTFNGATVAGDLLLYDNSGLITVDQDACNGLNLTGKINVSNHNTELVLPATITDSFEIIGY